MPTAQPHDLDHLAIWKPLNSRIGEMQLQRSSHTFDNPNNYGVYEGKLCVLDYGSKNAVAVMMEFNKEFREGLDEAFPPKAK